MPMNLVIQERRKELKLTQEQVAEYLGVSIPAVSKWENGTTNPDISLLPPLARLLKIDLNTLFCFQEDLSEQEISFLCKEIAEIVKTGGIAEGFKTAGRKIHDYPHNETLLHCLTFQLDGLLSMSGLPDEEKRRYDATLLIWYRRLAESRDSKIKDSAHFMMVSRLIRDGEYDRAQEILDLMPDKEDFMSSIADKRMLQINLYLRLGETEEAVKDLQNVLLTTVNKVQMLLCKMVDAELAGCGMQTAEKIADKASRMASLFDLWEYNSFIAPLQIAGAMEDADACIPLLRKLLDALCKPWDMGESPLFYRIAKTVDPERMLPAVLSELETDAAYSFLREREDFKELIAEYKKLIKQ